MKTSLVKTTLALLSCVALSGMPISGAAPARETDSAAELLKRAYTASMRGRTLAADLVLTSLVEGHCVTTTGKVRVMKPYEGEWSGGPSPIESPLPRFLGTLEAILPGSDHAYTLYFGVGGLMEGYRTRFQDPTNHKEVACTAWMKHIVVDSPMKAAEFAWAAPAGFSRFDPTVFDRSLLPVAALAPDFLLPRPGGGKIKLADARQKKKAVLVNFWFVACGPCRGEFPHLQKLYERLKGKGLEVIAINRGDTDKQVQRCLQEGKFTFPVALGGLKDAADSVYANFGVMAFPTNYLLDADGKVVWRAMGYNDFTSPEFKAALKQVGLE